MFYKISDGSVILRIKAQPGAGKSEFAGLYGEDALKVRIAAAAVDGAANRELTRFLSKSFKIPKSEIRFKGGETSKIKTLIFPLTDMFLDFAETVKAG